MKTILFLHLPKTAGQSVHQFLIDVRGKDNVCPARDNGQFDKLSPAELEQYTVYSGHFDWNLFDSFSNEKFTFIKLLFS